MGKQTKQAWEETLEEYLGFNGVMDDKAGLEHVERDGLKFVHRLNADWKAGKLADRLSSQNHEKFMIGNDQSYELMFWGNMSWLIFKDDENIGAAHPSFPYVSPEHRGKGIMSDIFVIGDEKGRNGKYTYSIGGFNARMEAHRKHVERAMRRGDAVPENVMQDYEYGSSGLVRTKKHSFTMHRDACEENTWKVRQEKYQILKQFYAYSFMELSKGKGDQANYDKSGTGVTFLKTLKKLNQGSSFVVAQMKRFIPEDGSVLGSFGYFVKIDDNYYDIHGQIDQNKAKAVITSNTGAVHENEFNEIKSFEEEEDFSQWLENNSWYPLDDVDHETLDEAVAKATALIRDMDASHDVSPSL